MDDFLNQPYIKSYKNLISTLEFNEDYESSDQCIFLEAMFRKEQLRSIEFRLVNVFDVFIIDSIEEPIDNKKGKVARGSIIKFNNLKDKNCVNIDIMGRIDYDKKRKPLHFNDRVNANVKFDSILGISKLKML